LKEEKKGEFYFHKGSPIIILNKTTYIGDSDQFLEWALQNFRYVDQTSVLIYRKRAADTYRSLINVKPGGKRSYVFMNVSYESQQHQVVFELFDEYCPKTCENFRKLCEGIKHSIAQGALLSYAGTEFHRVVKGMYV